MWHADRNEVPEALIHASIILSPYPRVFVCVFACLFVCLFIHYILYFLDERLNFYFPGIIVHAGLELREINLGILVLVKAFEDSFEKRDV